jgi:hypothetical protein
VACRALKEKIKAAHPDRVLATDSDCEVWG